MCPDKRDLSAFVDLELSTFAVEKINSHIENCESCRSEIESLKNTAAFIRGGRIADTAETEGRVWMKLRHYTPHGKSRFFHLRITLPAPLVLAMAVFIIFLSAGLLFTLRSNDRHPVISIDSIVSSSLELDNQDIEALLQYLYSSEAAVEISIPLPGEPKFIPMGEPQFLRAAEYRRNE